MKKHQANGFWTGGRDSRMDDLREEETELLRPLLDSLAKTTDPEVRQDLKYQIEAIRIDFKTKRKAARSSLFVKG